ncbi:hypothetical protein RRG08_039277 [Elysia crispata]|uniref:Neurotransmitter-gated ion-channel ligand-binding domain-containing protein n=1 Tax=Elysia crispata TaxID=231223 RepID=A0AAE0Z7F3_9GAST|nr:hypothetical protein RRG08_039277 [Elysia crispata]
MVVSITGPILRRCQGTVSITGPILRRCQGTVSITGPTPRRCEGLSVSRDQHLGGVRGLSVSRDQHLGGFGKSSNESLTSTTFNGYDKRIRPIIVGEPTYVDMVFELVSIIPLDETQQVLSTFARLTCQWSDQVLAWNASDLDGVPSFLWLYLAP